MDDHKNVMIYAETRDGSLSPITIELLGCGKKLASDLSKSVNEILTHSPTPLFIGSNSWVIGPKKTKKKKYERAKSSSSDRLRSCFK